MARKRGWRRYRGWAALAVLVVVAGAVYLFVQKSQPQAQGTTYQTSQAASGTVSVAVAGTGNLAVRDPVDVWPKTSGTVKSVSAVAGKSVKSGDVLYKIDPSPATQQTAQALAQKRQAWQSVVQAQLSVTQAKNELASLEDKASQTNSNVSDSDIKAAEEKVTAAKAGLSSAYASYDNAKLSYQYALDGQNNLTVKAPCSGKIWEVNIAAGDSVSTSGGGGLGDATSATLQLEQRAGRHRQRRAAWCRALDQRGRRAVDQARTGRGTHVRCPSRSDAHRQGRWDRHQRHGRTRALSRTASGSPST